MACGGAVTSMRSLPFAARLYVAAIVALGASVLVAFFPVHGLQRPALFVVLLVVSSVTSVFKVSLPLTKGGSSMSVSYAVDFVSLLLLGPHETMLIAAASAWSQCTFRMRERNPAYRTVFSVACLALSVQAAGKLFASLGGIPGSLNLVDQAGPLLGAATAYFVVNTVTIAGAIALSTRQRLADVWHENFLWSAPGYFVGAAAAMVAAAVVERSGYALVPLAAVPLYLSYRAYQVYLGRIDDEQRQVQQVSDLHLATVEALARAIDAKDQLSHGHIRRVQVYAASLARAVGMSEPELQGVRTAALLHDIGKLAVPEHILSKPGPLTQEEFQKIRIHPKVGADIIAEVPFPYPVAPLILSHHERWDGRGYPHGLQGDAIPLGARVLTVVDYFDAIMTERPYHKAMSREAALALLQEEAGKGLDPTLVRTFIDLLPGLAGEIKAIDAAEPAGRRPHGELHADPSRQAPVRRVQPGKANVFEDIALAHREIYALDEIAQARGTSIGIADTMSLIASKLSTLVPFSCCALFLYDEQSDTLQCRYATGTDAQIVQQIGVHSGDGVTGWVARTRTALLNGRPAADLEAAGLVSLSLTLQSALVCPLVLNDRFIGALSVYGLEADAYTEDHRRLLDRVCEQAAAVIHNSIVFEQTQEDSLTDPLTGLPNTRFLFMHLTRELARSERLKSPVSLLVMDLDNFKAINDNCGHHVGDRALCEVARVLRTAIRPYDVCIRYAGDEFILVLSDCGVEEAERKRLELQHAIDNLYFEARPGKQVALGVSVGAAVFPQDGEVYETLLATADSRMYQDKTARKRRSRPAHRHPERPAAVVN
jgi:diguanylate cyclase (GGDEF)-like protein/putative nucleotidyltransferase with HDIG domain